MRINEYQALALRTAKPMGSLVGDLNHAQIGIATEGGEFATIVKRAMIYGKWGEESRENAMEELGDVLWYIAIGLNALGVSMEECMQSNIAKLRERFPHAYSDEAAEARADKGGLDARNS